MFTTASRPRPPNVPSKAALRVLYQLAYISSGTAVGVGVLCAEERRRRTQIVQRIADNARRIRQHPRYAANATAAVAVSGEGEGEGYGGFGVNGLEMAEGRREEGHKNAERGQRKAARSQSEGRGFESLQGLDSGNEAIKGQDLPSVVEKEYGTLHTKSNRQSRWAQHKAERRATKANAGHLAPTGSTQTDSPNKSKALLGRNTPSPSPGTSVEFELRKKDSGLRHGESTPTLRGVPEQSSLRANPDRVEGKWSAETHRHKLLGDGERAEAISFWLRRARLRNEDAQVPEDLMRRLLDAALQENLLMDCAQLIRSISPSSRLFIPQCEALIRALDRQGRHAQLLDVFFKTGPLCRLVSLDDFSANVRTLLANACATDEGLYNEFEVLYRSLGSKHRFRIDRRRCHLMLKVTWRSTKNIEAVEAQLKTFREHLERETETASLRLVDTTMVKIYTSARCTEKALRAIARNYRSDPTDIRCALHAARIYAQKGLWNSFRETIQLAEDTFKNQSGADDHSLSVRAANFLAPIVEAYAEHHSASQTWRFVTYLQEHFNYQPDQSANRAILRTFVTRNAFDLIPHWLHRLRVAGNGWQIDGEVAAQLLSCFYEVYRPSHVLVMWFCRKLTRLVPSFDPLEFFALMKHSIGYDLSGAMERNATWQQAHAAERLKRLNAATEVPSPGYKHSRKLYFRHPDEQTETTEALAKGQEHRSPTLKEEGVGSDLGGEMENSTSSHPTHPLEKPASVNATTNKAHSIKYNRNLNVCHAKENLESGAQTSGGKASLDEESAVLDILTPNVQTGSAKSRVEEEMKILLSSHRYSEVLRLYERSRDGIGLPKTIFALVLAVRASLRKHGNDDHAMQMIIQTESAGMNVVPALAPVLIHHMQTLDPADPDAARHLCNLGIKYYRLGEENGIVTGHWVGVTAANVLVKSQRAKSAVRLLRAIYDSQYAKDRPVDIVYMTVMIRGYIALGSLPNVLHWVRETLRLDLRISPGFCRELKHGLKSMSSLTRRERAQMLAALETCRRRRREQAFEAKVFGRKLVATIARCMRQGTTVGVDERIEIDREVFGTTSEARDFTTDDEVFPAEKTPPHLTRRERLAKAQAHPCFSDQTRHAARMTDVKWLRQYRAFLRQPMVLEDGRYVSFRHYLPSESKGWRKKEKGRRERLRAERQVFWEEGQGAV